MKKTAIISKSAAMAMIIISLVISIIPALAAADSYASGHSQNAIVKHVIRQGFDVSSIPQRLVFDEAPVFEDDGMPSHGNQFINQGYIYPYGFLDNHAGTNPDGTPAYPEEVIGVWTCRGTFIADGAHTLTGPWVASTQLYDFYAEPGYEDGKYETHANLVSEGYEFSDIDTPFRRAITGGTGKMQWLPLSQLEQNFLGFSETMSVLLRFRIVR